MADEAVAMLAAMTGLGPEEAQGYLEMAGGDLDAAVGLYFQMSGGDGGGVVEQQQQQGYLGDLGLVGVVASEPLSSPWREQKLKFSEDGVGIVQEKNGPCGILTVIDGIIISGRLRRDGKVLGNPVDKEELSSVLAGIIEKCCIEETGKICQWRDGKVHEAMKVVEVPVAEIEGEILRLYDQYASPGGLELLICSCVLSHGIEKTRLEGEMPLIVGPNQLCSSELMMLFLTGRAKGDLGAYSILGGKNEVEIDAGIGMLSFSELESGIPVHDNMKTPLQPVWIIHSGDHFTILFSETKLKDYSPPLTLMHFNGLPPGGPRMVEVKVEGSSVAGKAPAVKKDIFFKPVPGEIEDVVQANPDDREARPDDWKSWTYEVILAIEDPSVQGAERPADNPAVTFDLGSPPPDNEPWRCGSCYRSRFQTMQFGQNEPGSHNCSACGRSKEDAQWSLHFKYSDLPPEWRKKMDRRHAPKVVSILQTKWPDCVVSTTDGSPLPTA